MHKSYPTYEMKTLDLVEKDQTGPGTAAAEVDTTLQFVKMPVNAFAPFKESKWAAGYDIRMYKSFPTHETKTLDSVDKDQMEPKTAVAEVDTTLQFVKLSVNAFAPCKMSKWAAGFDLYSAYFYDIQAQSQCVVKTDLQIRMPPGTYGRIAPRSGLAAANFIGIGAGVVDEDYNGSVGVVLFNHSREIFQVSKGDRIAQLICEVINHPELKQVEALGKTERGAGAFGSTGRN